MNQPLNKFGPVGACRGLIFIGSPFRDYTHTQGFFDSVKMSTDLQNAMKKLTQEVDMADDEAANGFSDGVSSSVDSFFVSGKAADTTLPTFSFLRFSLTYLQ